MCRCFNCKRSFNLRELPKLPKIKTKFPRFKKRPRWFSAAAMGTPVGALRVRVIRGINLAIRDKASRNSDPYVVLTTGGQKLKTRVVKSNCNPEWKDDLTLCILKDQPIILSVFDKDTFSGDDKMGVANLDIKPFLQNVEEIRMNCGDRLPVDGTVVYTVWPNDHNCLAKESDILVKKGKLVQELRLALKNVECGEIELELEFFDLPGAEH